jgi:hypothetical protein
MSDDQIHIGDAFRIGGALLEVTQPRLIGAALSKKSWLPPVLMVLKFTAYMAALSANFYHSPYK